MEALGLPYRIFGFDSETPSEVVGYARKVNEWMKSGGREQLRSQLRIVRYRALRAARSGDRRAGVRG